MLRFLTVFSTSLVIAFSAQADAISNKPEPIPGGFIINKTSVNELYQIAKSQRGSCRESPNSLSSLVTNDPQKKRFIQERFGQVTTYSCSGILPEYTKLENGTTVPSIFVFSNGILKMVSVNLANPFHYEKLRVKYKQQYGKPHSEQVSDFVEPYIDVQAYNLVASRGLLNTQQGKKLYAEGASIARKAWKQHLKDHKLKELTCGDIIWKTSGLDIELFNSCPGTVQRLVFMAVYTDKTFAERYENLDSDWISYQKK